LKPIGHTNSHWLKMSEILTAIILLLLATIDARFPFILFPSLFLTVYILWLIRSKMRISHILLVSFILAITLDAMDTSHIWLYPFFMPIVAYITTLIKQRVNLTLPPVRVVVFTILVFILFLPLFLYYNLSIQIMFLRSILTAFVIEGVLLLLWKGELG